MKSTQDTVQKRVEEVLAIRLLGAELPEIRKLSQKKRWGVSDDQLRRYIHRTDEVLAKMLEKDRERLLNRHIAQRRALFAACMQAEDYANARAVLKDEAELLALYPAGKLELSASGPPFKLYAGFSPDDV